MKTSFDKKMIVAVLTISSLALLTGCGSSPAAPAPPPPAAPAGVGGIVGGCVPINTTTTLGFNAMNMYMGSQQTGDMRVLGGIIPPGDSLASGGTPYGTMTVTPGNIAPPPVNPGFGGSLGTFQGQRVDGTSISMTVTSSTPQAVPPPGGYPGGYPGGIYPNAYPASGQVNATGYIQVSQFIQSLLIQTAIGSSYGFGNPILNNQPGQYPTGTPYQANQQICVSNIALSLQRTLPSTVPANWLYLGTIYFYINGGQLQGGQHGLALNF